MSGNTTLALNSVRPALLGRSTTVLCISGVKNILPTTRSCLTYSCRNVWMEHQGRLVPSVSLTESAALQDGAAGWIVSGAGLGALGVLLLKFIAYSQLEVVRTKMLGRYVARNESRVLQLGGTTRDLYYYPNGVVQVVVNAPDAPTSLYEQAGIQSGIPVSVNCESNTVEFLSSQKRNMFDCVVCFDQFDNSMTESEIKNVINSIHRVLKPGGSFVFYQRTKEGNSVFGGLAQSLGGKPSLDRDIGNLITFCNLWDFCEWDIASPSFDPHQVGVCIKSKDEETSKNSSVDSITFEQIRKRGKKNPKKS